MVRALGPLLLAALAAPAAAVEVDVYDAIAGVPGAVHDAAETPDGTIWFATDAGLVRFDGTGFETITTDEVPELRTNRVLSLGAAPNGLLFVGTELGLTRRARGGWAAMGKQQPALEGAPLRSIFLDDRRRIWYATDTGLYRSAERGAEEIRPNNRSLPRVNGIGESRDGDVWVAAETLLRFPGGDPLDAESVPGLPPVTAIASHQAGDLWIGTASGLYRHEPRGLVRVSELDVVALRADRDGAVWIAARSGELWRELDGVVERFELSSVPGGTTRPLLDDSTGALWIATAGGVARLRGVVRRSGSPAAGGFAPAIERVYLDGRRAPLQPGGSLRFTPLAASAAVAIEYGARGSNLPLELEYRYRMDGIDDEWVLAERRRSVRYGSVAPGRYRFRVQARRRFEDWDDAEATLRLTIAPRFYRTGWFRAGVVGTLALLVVGAFVLRARRARSRERALARQVAERTSDLHGAKLALEEANQSLERRVADGIDALRDAERMAAYGRLVAGVAHEVRQPLFAVSTITYVLADKLRGREDIAPQMDLLSREVKRMASMMDELLEFARPFKLLVAPTGLAELMAEAIETAGAEADPGDAPVELSSSCEPDLPAVRLDRARMLQVLVNLAQNARRHAAGVTRIALAARAGDADHVVLSVENDGAPIPPDILPQIFEPFFSGGRGTGLGLAIARRIVESHAGTLDVVSGDGQNTRFTIRLPVAGPA